MDEILIAHATKQGATHAVAESIAAGLTEAGVEAHTIRASRVRSLDEYSAVVLGAPVFMSCWHPDAAAFLLRLRKELAHRPLAVFALGPANDDTGQWELARRGVDEALARVPEVEPVTIGLFGEAIVPETLHFPVPGIPSGELRDDAAIDEWIVDLQEAFGLRSAV